MDESKKVLRCKLCEADLTNKPYVMFSQKYLCKECVGIVHMIGSMAYDKKVSGVVEGSKSTEFDIPSPKEICNYLSEYVIGQDSAKRKIASAAYSHMMRCSHPEDELKKSNVLMLGPTGSGKTYMIEKLAKLLQVPFVIVGATNYTEEGYIGDSVNSIIDKLYTASNQDKELCEKGIVYIDEFDKLCLPTNKMREVGSRGVQQALLKLIEDTEVVCGKVGQFGSGVTVSTKNILFICGGAFEGINEMTRKRVSPKSMGFGGTIESTYETLELTNEDLISYGIIPEMLGRLPVRVELSALSEDTLVDILVSSKDSVLTQYVKLFSYEGVELSFTKEALREIARQSVKRGVGSRALRAVFEDLVSEHYYDLCGGSGGSLRFSVVNGEVVGKVKKLQAACAS